MSYVSKVNEENLENKEVTNVIKEEEDINKHELPKNASYPSLEEYLKLKESREPRFRM